MFGGTFDQQDPSNQDEEPAYVPDMGAMSGATSASYGQPTGGDVASYLNAGTYFKGILRSERSIGIDGHFEGEIQSEADIVIGREAEVKANIKASNVIISGKVMGHIACATLEIQSSGKVFGNIAAGSLLIAMGAVFRGQSLMGAEEEGAAAAVATDGQAAATGALTEVTDAAPLEISDVEEP